LLNFFMEHIQGPDKKNIVLVGVGNLGSALLNYKFNNLSDKMNVVAGLDNNEELIGTKINDVTIHHSDELESIIKKGNVEVVILSLPVLVSQKMAERLVDASIKGILNFTPTRLDLNKKIYVHNIDLCVELQALFFYMKNL